MHTDVDDDLRARAPASAVITETLRAQSFAAPRGRWAKVSGRSPLLHDARPWYVGALGEREVARRVDRLGPGWHVFHSVPIGERGSDIDHLVIGPAGVFTVNTKHHAGATVWVGSRRLMVNGQRTDHLRNSAYEAKRVARLLSAATGGDVEVTALIVIVAARRLTIREQPVGVTVLEAARVARWLQSRRPSLDEGRVARLTAAAARHATWGTSPPPRADLARFDELQSDVRRAQARRGLWAASGLIAMTGTALLVLPHVPRLVSDVLLILSP